MSTPYSFDEMLKQASFKNFLFKSLIKEKKKKFLFKSILIRHELVIEVWEDAGLI